MADYYELKFKCPECEQFAEIDIVHHNTTYRETFIMDSGGDAEYLESEVVDYGDNSTYHCSRCGALLPKQAQESWDELTEWLKRRPENLDRIMENL